MYCESRYRISWLPLLGNLFFGVRERPRRCTCVPYNMHYARPLLNVRRDNTCTFGERERVPCRWSQLYFNGILPLKKKGISSNNASFYILFDRTMQYLTTRELHENAFPSIPLVLLADSPPSPLRQTSDRHRRNTNAPLLLRCYYFFKLNNIYTTERPSPTTLHLHCPPNWKLSRPFLHSARMHACMHSTPRPQHPLNPRELNE